MQLHPPEPRLQRELRPPSLPRRLQPRPSPYGASFSNPLLHQAAVMPLPMHSAALLGALRVMVSHQCAQGGRASALCGRFLASPLSPDPPPPPPLTTCSSYSTVLQPQTPMAQQGWQQVQALAVCGRPVPPVCFSAARPIAPVCASPPRPHQRPWHWHPDPQIPSHPRCTAGLRAALVSCCRLALSLRLLSSLPSSQRWVSRHYKH